MLRTAMRRARFSRMRPDWSCWATGTVRSHAPCAASKHLLEVAFLCSSFDRVLRPFVGLFFPYLFRAFGYVCRPVVCGFSYFFIKNFGMLFFTPIFAVPKRIGFAKVFCGNSSVGRAQPCQGWGREFESRFPLRRSFSKDLFCWAKVAQ